jgi:hypothetical protein
MSLLERNMPESVIELIPEAIARENNIIAVECSPEFVTIACPDESFGPLEEEKIRFVLDCPIRWEHHPRAEIQSAIDRHYDRARVENCAWKFRFQCPERWVNFATTNDDRVRFCSVCSRQVYLCSDDAEVVRHAKLGHCIARDDGIGCELIGDVELD